MSRAPSSKLVRGTVDLMVLKSLERGPSHGLGIARWIREGCDDMLRFQDAALYQSLHRLERKGMVESAWGRSGTNRKARLYELTDKGRKRLEDETKEFRTLTAAIGRLLEAGGGEA